ncbi:MAG TPA: NB-ARC domain-containing protein [Candidatus Limnocylindria bacterium]|nr:NB-ARC domain-containing protein [Candidatus Limnocylindria bacterium]
MAHARLLTLTGPGGTGKTRLSIRVAEEVLPNFEHGCWFVELDALRDHELVPATIAGVPDVKVPPDSSPVAALQGWLADRQLLLVLDNFEQVADAAQACPDLLSVAPRLRILVTSRTPLHVYGEQEYAVPPLASARELRDSSRRGVEALTQYEAVQLFIERALAVKADFAVTNDNAPAVAEICARLDGLPLAIELAAARIKLLTPAEMLTRLEQNLSVVSSSARDLPERQRTLRGAIDWSHELLSEPEQTLFARLSVFRGGFALSAAESVCADDALGLDVLDGVAALVDHSLMHANQPGDESRFDMLETIPTERPSGLRWGQGLSWSGLCLPWVPSAPRAIPPT